MGHSVTGFIVPASAAQEISANTPQLRHAPLEKGLVLFPLTDELLESLFEPSSHRYPIFTHLSNNLLNVLVALSNSSPILYFETDYHAGVGSQSAVLFRGGQIVFGPEHSDRQRSNSSPISEALEQMGIHAEAPAKDAFEEVGLPRYRNTEDCLDAIP